MFTLLRKFHLINNKPTVPLHVQSQRSLFLPFLCVYNNTKKQNSDEKWEWPGNIMTWMMSGGHKLNVGGSRVLIFKYVYTKHGRSVSYQSCSFDHTNIHSLHQWWNTAYRRYLQSRPLLCFINPPCVYLLSFKPSPIWIYYCKCKRTIIMGLRLHKYNSCTKNYIITITTSRTMGSGDVTRQIYQHLPELYKVAW